jgi:hypothetical protein
MKETRRRFEVNRLNEDLVGCSATVFGLGCGATLRIHPYLEDRSQVSSEEAIHCAPPLICDGGLPKARDRAFFIGMQCAHHKKVLRNGQGRGGRCDAIATSRSSCGSRDTPSRVSALVRRKGADPTCATSASPMSPKSPNNPFGDCPYRVGLLVDVAGQPGTPARRVRPAVCVGSHVRGYAMCGTTIT